ncbi:MAG: hypothetical protein NZT92_19815 [Abditibacteriales bacterium]|nr:hypothetical protein [Abditibacteriales bacterium]
MMTETTSYATPQLVTWVLVGIGLYWAYCLYWGIRGYLQTKSAAGWMIAGRNLPVWLFVLAGTATSFSGWTYIGHPGTIQSAGLSYAFAGLYAITIPFTGVLFLKWQWMIGRRYGFVTPPEMYRTVFNNRMLGWMVVVIAFFYSLFYVAVQLIASGLLFNVLTGGFIPYFLGGVLLSAVMLFYVMAGGLRTIAWVDALQAVLLGAGIMILGAAVVNGLGGWGALLGAIDQLPAHFRTMDPHGVIHWLPNWEHPESKVKLWSGMMMMTYMFALAGIQCSPSFTMWAFSNRHPKGMAWQQVVGSGLIIGFILCVFSVIQGMGALTLAQVQGNQAYTKEGLTALITGAGGLGSATDAMVPRLMIDYLPLPLLVLVSIGGLAAIQSTGAPYISSAGAILARDLIGQLFAHRRQVVPHHPPLTLHQLRSDSVQIWWARLFCFLIVMGSFVIAWFNPDLIVMLGGLAVSLSFTLSVPLFVLCYKPAWVSGKALGWGVLAGVIAVFATYLFPEYRYPLTIHSAGWGLLATVMVTFLVSRFAQPTAEEVKFQQDIHDYWRKVDPEAFAPRALAWRRAVPFFAAAWWLLFVGPGIALIGDNMPRVFGLPPLWVWLLLGWVTGVMLLAVMAWGARLSAPPQQMPEPISQEAERTITTA